MNFLLRYQNEEFISPFKLPISPYLRFCGVPSTSNWYYGFSGQIIPFFSLTFPEQTGSDLYAHSTEGYQTIYRQESTLTSNDPKLILAELLQGRTRVSWDQYVTPLYILIMKKMQRAEWFGYFTTEMVRDLIRYPANPGANFAKATQIVDDIIRSQEYLDEIGVVHFKAIDISRYPNSIKLFYLTRFYGSSVQSPIGYEHEGQLRYFYLQCQTSASRQFVSTIKTLITDIAPIFQIIQDIDRSVGIEFTVNQLGITYFPRFIYSGADYLNLLDKKPSPLTKWSFKNLTRNQIETLLINHKEVQIVNVLGDSKDETRDAFIETMIERIYKDQVVILSAEEAKSCVNDLTIVEILPFSEVPQFLGVGSYQTGFKCYIINELVASLEATGNDPLGFQLSISILEEILQVTQDQRFKDLIENAKYKRDVITKAVKELREWTNEHPDNKVIMYDLWIAYFNMGMYMRQWRGPGYPYPLIAGETGEEAESTSETAIRISKGIDKELKIYQQIMSQLPESIRELISNLTVWYKNTHGQLISVSQTIGERMEVVLTDQYCIRMASAPWVYTAALYMKEIVNESIPGFNLNYQIDFIY